MVRVRNARSTHFGKPRGRTSSVVAHRLSTIRDADKVLVVVDHQIVEHGTHQELLAPRGRYSELYTSNTLARRDEAEV
jgi:ABC-type multidrug transport system fused ATPase/permease subunit